MASKAVARTRTTPTKRALKAVPPAKRDPISSLRFVPSGKWTNGAITVQTGKSNVASIRDLDERASDVTIARNLSIADLLAQSNAPGQVALAGEIGIRQSAVSLGNAQGLVMWRILKDAPRTSVADLRTVQTVCGSPRSMGNPGKVAAFVAAQDKSGRVTGKVLLAAFLAEYARTTSAEFRMPARGTAGGRIKVTYATNNDLFRAALDLLKAFDPAKGQTAKGLVSALRNYAMAAERNVPLAAIHAGTTKRPATKRPAVGETRALAGVEVADAAASA